MSPNGRPNKLIKNLLSVTGIVLLAKLLGFVKQMIKAQLFGATPETDMLALSEGVIHDVEYVLAQTLITVFVPIYHHAQAEDTKQAANFVSNSLKFFLLIGCAGACLIGFFAPFVSKLIAPSYTPESARLLTVYIRIFAPGFVFIILIAYFAALLRANERFVLAEAVHLNQSLLLIAVMLLFRRVFGVNSLAIGFYVYVGVNFALLLASSKTYRHIRRGGLSWDPYLKRLLYMTGAPLFGYSMVFINQLVDKILVSGLQSGALTSMGYAAVLSNFVGAIIGSFCSVLYPYLSQSVAANDNQYVIELVRRNMILMVTLLLPVSVLTIFNAEDIVTVVFARGAFGEEAILTTARALTGYAFMFAPLAMRDLFTRLFFCYQDSRRPTVNNIVGILCNIALDIALCPRFGVLGITAATSFSVLVGAFLNFVTFYRKHRFFNLSPMLRYVPLWCMGAVACAFLCGFASACFSEFHTLLKLILTFLLAGGGYLLVTFPALLYYVRRKP